MASSYCKQCLKPFATLDEMFNAKWCADCQLISDKAAEALKKSNPGCTPDEILEASRMARLQNAAHPRQQYINPRDFNPHPARTPNQ